ncbi:hypothetical protein CN558_04405 [Bacillus wiedmannii]|uniref:Nuclease SbcCD subunit C n=1 Tax=Bacillus wiedmannii TaxID=1890302 RepID=A0A2B6U343_9BACI|nr:AAA family ATPase [Bacillus wiedmannii]PEM89608.1 hypothetical protein CN627_07810 [Bacillus wiedmannii]PEO88221.1 hypothetical protein CN558_04405 [Bacillus wiedmannii]PGD64420.1 hypothetical protein COM41_11095 [Bacillus wiedmannii]PHG59833.1 hypothetical protein COI65_16730 [Bacillus wiedmannii]
MSRKISEVELEAFRAFKEKKVLQLTAENGELANLIVIYAPNGTGKTSFFDAIEWGLTGEIQRITGNKRVEELTKKQSEQYILKNKYSQLDTGKVVIKFSDGSLVDVATKKPNKRLKTDYKEGINSSEYINFTPSDAKKFVRNNLLTHDQIDSFLRFKNAKERYAALSIFWDSENTTESYINVLKVISAVESYLEGLNSKMVEIGKELASFQDYRDSEKLLYKNMEQYSSYLPNGQIQEMRVIPKSELVNFYSEEFKSITQVLSKMNNKSFELNKIGVMFQTDYPESLKELNRLNKIELPRITKLEQSLNKLDFLKNDNKNLHKELVEIKEKVRVLEYLIEYQQIYEDIKSKKENLLILIKEHGERKSRASKESIVTQEIIDGFKIKLANSNKEQEKLELRLKKTRELTKYPTIKENLNEINVQLKEYESKISNNRVAKERILSFINECKTILKTNANELWTYEKQIENLNEDLYENYKNIKFKIEEIKAIDSEIYKYREEIELLKKIGSDLNKLKILGTDIVKKTKTKTCPLCNYTHESNEQLLKTLLDTILSNDSVSMLNDKIQTMMQIKKKCLVDMENAHLQFKDSLKQIIENLSNDLGEKEQKNVELMNYQKKLKLEKSEYEKKQEELKSLLDNLKYQFSIENMDLEIDKIYIDLKSEIFRKQEEIEQIEGNLQVKEAELKHNILVQNGEIKNIEDFKNKVFLLEKDELYLKYQSYQRKINIELEKLTTELEKYRDHMKSINDNLIGINGEIELLKSQLVDVDRNKFEFEELEIQKKISNLQMNISDMKNSLSIHFPNGVVNYKEIIYEKEKLNLQIQMMEKRLALLSLIMDNLDILDDLEIVKNKEQQIDDLEDVIESVNSELNRLNDLRDKLLGYIKFKIQNVFDLHSINSIFQMINPHQRLTEIGFEIEEDKEGFLGLNILCGENDCENKEESPTLYLSSAQVNILSLSIFFASALQNANDFESILLDDPLQHLDGLNTLSLIDLLRIICFKYDKQVILSTHDKNFYNLCRKKIDGNYFNATYIDMSFKI